MEVPDLPPIPGLEAPSTTAVAAAGVGESRISIKELKQRRRRVLWARVRGPLFLFILAVVFVVVLLFSIRSRKPTRLTSVTGRSVVLSVVIHLMVLLLLDSWILSRRVLQTIRDPEFEILLDSESLAEERISLGIREETAHLPQADATLMVAPQMADLPVPEAIPVEETPDVVPARPDATAFEIPLEFVRPAQRERETPSEALAARPVNDFRIQPPTLRLEAPKLHNAPKPLKPDRLESTMPLDKDENLIDPTAAIQQPTVDLPPLDFAPALESSTVETPAAQAAAPALPDPTRDIQPLPVRLQVEMPEVRLTIAKLERPKEQDSPPPDVPADTQQEMAEIPTPPARVEAAPLEPAAPKLASLIPTTVPFGSPDATAAEPSPPQRVIAPHPMPRPVPAPFTFEEMPVIEEPYRLRRPEVRIKVIEDMGGTPETEQAVKDALAWLAAHQSDDGRWDIDGFDEQCGKCGGAGKIGNQDVAATALAALAFLGAGHTHMHEGTYRENVKRAVDWLVSQAKDDGDLRGRGNMYDQGMATIALAEAYGMTKDASLRLVVERAVAFIAAAQNPKTGGWRYYPRLDSDTSVFGWQVMALKSAAMSGLSVPDDVLKSAAKWLDHVSSGRSGGLYAYQAGESPSFAMVAEGMFSRQLLGRKPSHPSMKETAEYLRQRLPGGSETNFYYYYYGTLAMFQHQGPPWEDWNRAMRKVLLPTQAESDARRGSWAPEGQWSSEGGRVVQTALATLCLEVYYRYLPLYSPMSDSTVAQGGD